MNYGKKFEQQFKKNWLQTVDDTIVVRLYDPMSGYSSISNISDFVCYKYPNIFFIECKTHSGASLPFSAVSQYEKMFTASLATGVKCGIVLWLYEKDKVLYIPISAVKSLKDNGESSVGIRHLGSYGIIEIPSKKLKKFMDSDYSVLIDTFIRSE